MHAADREVIKELSPAAMRRRARQLEEDGLELCRRATALRVHAARILAERTKAKRKK